MKKLIIYLFLAILVVGFTSCGDNVLFSELHVLTPDEEAELARQDSIAEAERNKINANLVLEYDLEITLSAAQYSGGAVTVEVDKIAELFGISTEDLLAGIAGEDGAPEVMGFAIEGSTHADNTIPSNTNATWGHWWDANGDVIGWGDNAMVAAEFDPATGVFNVVQYPGHLVDGQTIKFIEGLKLEDLRAAVVINITAKAAAKLEVEVVNTQNITVELKTKSVYDADPVDFDLDMVLNDLGIDSIRAGKYVATNEDGSFAEEYSADPTGFWYDMNGYASSWGDNASVYVTYDAFEDNQIGIGQYPDHMTDGQTLELDFGFFANDKIEMLHITINFVADDGGGGGEPVDELGIVNTQYLSVDVTAKSSYDADPVTFDLDQTYTDLGISSMDEVTFVGLNADESIAESYTADPPGYWYDMDGWVGNWGENSSVYTNYGAFEENQIGVGQYPDHLSTGQTIVINYGIKANGKIEMLNITVNVVDFVDPEDQPTGDPTEVEETFEVSQAYAADWSANSRVDVKELLRDAFKMTTFQIHQAIVNGELVFTGINTDGSAYTDADGNAVSTANYPGHWFGADGNVTVWGSADNAPIVYSELAHSETSLELSIGHHPDNAKSGDTVTIKQVAELNGGKATFTITVTID